MPQGLRVRVSLPAPLLRCCCAPLLVAVSAIHNSVGKIGKLLHGNAFGSTSLQFRFYQRIEDYFHGEACHPNGRWERSAAAERTRKRLHTVTCYLPCYWQEWRDTDWFKTRVPDQTQKRPHFIQSANRPSPSTLPQPTRTTQPHFHLNRWAAGPWELQNAAADGPYSLFWQDLKGEQERRTASRQGNRSNQGAMRPATSRLWNARYSNSFHWLFTVEMG